MSGRRTAVAAGTGLVALLAVGAWALGTFAGPSMRSGRDGGPSTTVAHVPGDCHRSADEHRPELEVVVDAEPTTGLEDGSTVAVGTDCLGPGAGASVVTCRPGDELWWDRCDTGARWGYRVPASGVLAVEVDVARVITPTTGDAVDCASAPGACTLMIASAEDEWGEVPLTFRDDLPPVTVERRDGDVYRFNGGTATPDGRLAVGDDVAVEVSGFEPGEELIVGLCSDDALDGGLARWCQVLTTGTYDLRDEGMLPPPVVRGDGTASFTAPVLRWARPTAAAFTLDDDDDAEDDVRVDCTERPGRCLLVVAAAVDLQRLSVFPLDVGPR